MEIKWHDPQKAFESKKEDLLKIYLNLYDKVYHPSILAMFQNLKIAYYGKEALLRSTLEQINLIASMDTYVFFRRMEKEYPKASEECLEILEGKRQDYSDSRTSSLSQQLFEGPFFIVPFSKEETKQLLEEVISEYPPFALEVKRGVFDLDLLSEQEEMGAIHFGANPLHYVREEYDEEAKDKESKAFQMRYQLWKKEYPEVPLSEFTNEMYEKMLQRLRTLEPIVAKEEQYLKDQVTPYLKWWFSYHLCNIYHILHAERQLCQSMYYHFEDEDQQTMTDNPNFSPRALKGFSTFMKANPDYHLIDDFCTPRGSQWEEAYNHAKRSYFEQKIRLSFLSPIELEDGKRIYQNYNEFSETMIGFSYHNILCLNLDRKDSIDDNFDLMIRSHLEQKRTIGGAIYKWGLMGNEKSEGLAALDIASNLYISKKVREEREWAKLRIWDRQWNSFPQETSHDRFERLLEVLPLSDFLEARIAPDLNPLLKHGITLGELEELGNLVVAKDEASGTTLTQKITELKAKQKRK